MKKQITKSEKQTFNLGKNLAKKLKGGEVIGLVGDLGAGKTVFTKGLARGLGIKKVITSPTFILMNVYPVMPKAFYGVKQLIHIDCYRIKSLQEILDIGAEQYFGRPDTVVVIEWADKLKKILPKNTILIEVEVKKGNQRSIKSI